MLSSRRFFNQLFFCFLLSALVIYNVRARQIRAANEKCVGFGEYCRTNSDCCKGLSCPLWQDQRCKYTAGGVEVEIAALPDDKSKTGTQALEKVDSSVLKTYSPQLDANLNLSCRGLGEPCYSGEMCCSKRCYSFAAKCVL